MPKAIHRVKRKNNTYFPIIDDRYICEPGSITARGDRHANHNTMMNDYIEDGLIHMSRDDQAQFVHLYFVDLLAIDDTETLKKHIQLFRKILDQVKVLTTCTYLELGDETGDRGNDDLKIHSTIKKLRSEKVKLKVFPSNHGIATITSREQGIYKSYDVADLQAVSIAVLQHLINHGAIEKKEIDDMIDEHYYEACSDLIDVHSFQQNPGNDDSLICFSHAKIDIDDIKALAQQFGVECHLDTIENTKATAKRINEFYKKKLFAKEIHTLLPTLEQLAQSNVTPLYVLLWKRLNDRVGFNAGKFTYFCSGHDGAGQYSNSMIIDLDNQNGKESVLDSDSFYPVFRIVSEQVQIDIDELRKEIKDNKLVCQYVTNAISDIEDLISDRNIFSSKQVKRLKETLFNNNSESLWKELIGTDTEIKKQFISAIRNTSTLEMIDKKYVPCSFLDVLSRMKENDILTKENLKRILKHHQHSEKIYQIFLILMQAHNQPGLLNQNSFSLIMMQFDNIQKAGKIELIITTLYEAREADLLNPKSIEFHIINTLHSRYYLNKLKLANLVKYILPEFHQKACNLDDRTAASIYNLLYIFNEKSHEFNPFNNNMDQTILNAPFRDNDVAYIVEFFMKNTAIPNFIAMINKIFDHLEKNGIFGFISIDKLVRLQDQNTQEIKQLYDILEICKGHSLNQEQFNFIVKYFGVFQTFLNYDTLTSERIYFIFNNAKFIELFIPMIEAMDQQGILAQEKGNPHLNSIRMISEMINHLYQSDIKFNKTKAQDIAPQNICHINSINELCKKDLILIYNLFDLSYKKMGKWLSCRTINVILKIMDLRLENQLHNDLMQTIPTVFSQTKNRLDLKSIKSNYINYLSIILPNFYYLDLINKQNMEKIAQHILHTQEIINLLGIYCDIFKINNANQAIKISQETFDHIFSLAPYYAYVTKTLANHGLLPFSTNEASKLADKYLSASANYISDIRLISHILNRFKNYRGFLPVFLEHIDDVLPRIRQTKSEVTSDKQDDVTFVQQYVKIILMEFPKFASLLSSNRSYRNSNSSSHLFPSSTETQIPRQKQNGHQKKPSL